MPIFPDPYIVDVNEMHDFFYSFITKLYFIQTTSNYIHVNVKKYENVPFILFVNLMQHL